MQTEPELGGPVGALWVNGIVAIRDGQPYVVLSKGTDRIAQLSMAEARNLAFDLLLMSSRTEADAMIHKFFSKMSFPSGASSALMIEFRDFRAELDKEDPRMK